MVGSSCTLQPSHTPHTNTHYTHTYTYKYTLHTLMHTPTTANCFNQHVAAVLSPLLLLLLTASPLLARPRSPLQAESFIFQKSTSSSKCFQYATPPLPSLAVLRLSAFMAKICELSKSATKIALKLQIMWQEQSNGKWHGKRGRRGSVEEGGGALVNDSHGVQQATQRGCF